MKKILTILVIVVLVAGFIGYRIYQAKQAELMSKFASGNGRLEATEVYITSDLGGEIAEILVERGDLVKKGDLLVKMDTKRLEADRKSAEAKKQSAEAKKLSADAQLESKQAVMQSKKAKVGVAECEVNVAQAGLEQAKTLLDNAKNEYDRYQGLLEKNAGTSQDRDNAKTRYESKQAEFIAAEATLKQKQANLAVVQAEVAEAEADIKEAQADIAEAEAEIEEAKAEIDSIDVDLEKSYLYAPRGGRIQYNLAYAGEVVSAGGRVLNLADMTDVYLAFFLPGRQAGKLAIGAEAHIVLDALPEYPVPAKITYVASTAQFTPKTVETEVEREKLMFRVEARVDETLLQEYVEYIKTGMPGVAWVKLDDGTDWPVELQLKSAESAESADNNK